MCVLEKRRYALSVIGDWFGVGVRFAGLVPVSTVSCVADTHGADTEP